MSNKKSSDGGDIKQLQAQVESTKKVMMQNIDLAIDRGAKLDEIEDKSNKLSAAADNFKRQSKKVKRHFCLMYWKYIAILVFVIGLIALVIYLIVR